MKVFKVINKQACKYLKPSKVKFKQPFWKRTAKRKRQQEIAIIKKENLIAILKEMKRKDR